jgi:hypothetical protein
MEAIRISVPVLVEAGDERGTQRHVDVLELSFDLLNSAAERTPMPIVIRTLGAMAGGRVA